MRPARTFEVEEHVGIKRARIDVYIENSIHGYVCAGRKCYENRLLRNFYLLLWGMLTNSNPGGFRAWNGITFTGHTSGDLSCGKAAICACKETTEAPFNAYTCSSPGGADVGGIAVEQNCASWSAALNHSAESIIAVFKLFSTDRRCYSTAIAHKVLTVAAGNTVKHKICFNDPWLPNAAAMIAAVACNCNNIEAEDIGGNKFNLNGAGDLVDGPADIVLVTDAGNIVPTMYRYSEITSQYAYIHLVGVIATTQAITPKRTVLAAKLHGTDGATHLVPIIEIGGITLEANKVYSIAVHIFGG